jgi:hypothetical protein
MAELPADVGTGVVRIKVRRVGLVEGAPPETDPVTGKVVFTTSVPMLRHTVTNEIYVSTPVTAYLDKGDAVVELIATNDAQISPINWTYTVNFVLDDALVVEPISISVAEGTDVELATIIPLSDASGNFYIQGPPGQDGHADPQSIADVVGVHIVAQDNTPSATTMYGKPVVWIPGGSTLTPVPTTPTAPTFDYTNYAVTPPSIVGVEYQFYDPTGATWLPIPSGTATSLAGFTRPFIAKVRTAAKPGYLLTANYEWNAMFYTESSLVLWATDSFSGAAGVPLCGINSTNPRTFDMAGGGSATGVGIPKWIYGHPTISAGWMTNGAGLAVRNDADSTHGAASDYKNGAGPFTIGADNWRVEVDVGTYDFAHGRAFQVTAGGIQVGITGDTPNSLVTFNAVGPVAAVSYEYLNPRGSAPGTWKWTLMNKSLQFTAPDGRVWTRDYSAASTVQLGALNSCTLGWSDYSGAAPGVPPTLNNVRVYK